MGKLNIFFSIFFNFFFLFHSSEILTFFRTMNAIPQPVDIASQDSTDGLIASLSNCLKQGETITGMSGKHMKSQGIVGKSFFDWDLKDLSEPQKKIFKRLQSSFEGQEGKRSH